MLREIRPDPAEQEIIHDSLTFEQVSTIVGGFVEPISCPNGLSMLVNGDGNLLRLPLNIVASRIYNPKGALPKSEWDIVGTVIVGTHADIARILG